MPGGLDLDHLRLTRNAEAVAAAHPESLLTIGKFRDAAGIGRNMTVPLLGHFNASGFTIRIQEGRRILGDRRAIFRLVDDIDRHMINDRETA